MQHVYFIIIYGLALRVYTRHAIAWPSSAASYNLSYVDLIFDWMQRTDYSALAERHVISNTMDMDNDMDIIYVRSSFTAC